MKSMVLFVSLSLYCSGCATRTIHVRTTPPGATIYAANKISETPCSLKIPRETKTIRLDLEGYQEESIELAEPAARQVLSLAGLGLGRSSQGIGAVLAGTGFLVLLLALQNDDWDSDEVVDEDDWEVLGVAGIALVTGLGFVAFGDVVVEQSEDLSLDHMHIRLTPLEDSSSDADGELP